MTLTVPNREHCHREGHVGLFGLYAMTLRLKNTGMGNLEKGLQRTANCSMIQLGGRFYGFFN